MLRGIFRKRRHLLHLLFQTATATLRDAFRTRLALPDGRIAREQAGGWRQEAAGLRFYFSLRSKALHSAPPASSLKPQA